jgi:amidase
VSSIPPDPGGDDLAFAGVVGLLERLRTGTITSRALVELFLDRIARFDDRLGAFTTVLATSARAEADAADRQRAQEGARAPALLGLPIAIKDNTDVRGVATRYGTGSPELPAAFDSEVVRLLRAAGCVILGKTTMPELALFAFGPARNPWDPSRTSGGSSSGSAAAVAAGLVPAATASDGGGSIRIPAALCGLVGLKPTPGMVPLGPDSEHWSGLSAAGFLTRSVADTAALLDAVRDSGGSADPATDLARPAARDPAPLRIGLTRIGSTGSRPVPLHPEVFGALDETAGRLAALGHAVSPVEPSIGRVQASFVPLYLRGARDDRVRLVEPRALGAPARFLAGAGRLISDRQVASARRRADRLRARMFGFFRNLDVLLMPAVPAPAGPADRFDRSGVLPTVLGSADQVGFTAPWNVVGFPAVSAPAGFSSAGLPLAVQLVATPGGEGTLLALAGQLERDGDLPAARPSLGWPPGTR